MLRKLSLLALLLVLALPAHATRTSATFGDKNSSGVPRFYADTDGKVNFASDTAIVWPYNTSYNENSTSGANAVSISTTGSQTLTIADSGRTVVDFGGRAVGDSASGMGLKYVLPACSSSTLGAQYIFDVATKSSITVDTATTSDFIAYSISGTALDGGDSIKSTGQAGDSVTLKCSNANVWTVESMKGTWTDNSTN